jgi:hypothetical protein
VWNARCAKAAKSARKSASDFVIAHEPLYLRLPRHGGLFRTLPDLHLPEWRDFEVLRRSPRR